MTCFKSLLRLLLIATCLAVQPAAMAQSGDEVIMEGTWGGYAAAQIYAQRTLYAAMQSAASWLSDYCAQRGRCVESSDDIYDIENQLKELMPVNPYAVAQGVKAPVRIVFDEALTETMLNTYRTKPPESWRAPAGTVTVLISNTSGMFAIWCAGFEQVPARHELSHRVLFVVRKCHQPT